MKNNKGITLIALVITIIVMLILVGVTVSAAINGKLFDTAKKAAKDTEKAKQEELDYMEDAKNKIDEILGVTTDDKVEEIISKPVEGETEVYAILFSDGTMELRKEKPTETENVVFKTDESFSNKLFKSQEEIPWISYVDSIKEVKIADEIVPRTTARWFQGLKNLTTISNIENLKTDKVVSMESMFEGCTSLKEVDVSRFNTQEVINMSFMFYGCTGLENLDVSNFDTSKVTTLYAMFYDCRKVKTLDVANWDTSNVKNMGWMFYRTSVTKLSVENWKTNKVESFTHMFWQCEKVTELNLSKWDTSSATNMNAMFARCYGLTKIDVSSFNTSKVKDMVWMFRMCSSLSKLDISNFDTSNCLYFYWMFESCSNLEELNLGNINTSKVESYHGMFNGCTKIKTTITIDAKALEGVKIDKDHGYAQMLSGAATAEGAQITIRYKASQKGIIDEMVKTKSTSSNIVLEEIAK